MRRKSIVGMEVAVAYSRGGRITATIICGSTLMSGTHGVKPTMMPRASRATGATTPVCSANRSEAAISSMATTKLRIATLTGSLSHPVETPLSASADVTGAGVA